MKLQDYRDTADTFSGKASDACRQLAFAAIGLIWVFKKDLEGTGLISFPEVLIWAAVFVIFALALDLTQYVLGYLIYWQYFRMLEKKDTPKSKELPYHSPLLNKPIEVCYWTKILSVALAYFFLGKFLFHQIVIS